MKIYSATQRYPYTAELWDTYTVAGQTDGAGQPIPFYYKRADIKLDINVDENQLRVHIYSNVPIARNAQVRNVRHYSGEELLPQGAYQIKVVNPRINPMGIKEGYHMVAALIYAGDFEYEFEEDKPTGAE